MVEIHTSRPMHRTFWLHKVLTRLQIEVAFKIPSTIWTSMELLASLVTMWVNTSTESQRTTTQTASYFYHSLDLLEGLRIRISTRTITIKRRHSANTTQTTRITSSTLAKLQLTHTSWLTANWIMDSSHLCLEALRFYLAATNLSLGEYSKIC